MHYLSIYISQQLTSGTTNRKLTVDLLLIQPVQFVCVCDMHLPVSNILILSDDICTAFYFVNKTKNGLCGAISKFLSAIIIIMIDASFGKINNWVKLMHCMQSIDSCYFSKWEQPIGECFLLLPFLIFLNVCFYLYMSSPISHPTLITHNSRAPSTPHSKWACPFSCKLVHANASSCGMITWLTMHFSSTYFSTVHSLFNETIDTADLSWAIKL